MIMTLGVLLLCADLVWATDVANTGETRKVLAEHETVSVFEGVRFRKCMGRTALCPERCGDSGEFATFKVETYVSYKQHGKYGGKQTTFLIQVSDFHKKPKGDSEILKTVRSLESGDRVKLSWLHEYITRNGSSFPERTIVKLKKTQAP